LDRPSTSTAVTTSRAMPIAHLPRQGCERCRETCGNDVLKSDTAAGTNIFSKTAGVLTLERND